MTSTRRRYLAAVTTLLGMGTGCLGRPEGTDPSGTATAADTPTATDDGTGSGDADESVTVTRSRASGWAPSDWERTLTVSTADGRVTETLSCGDETETDSASLSASELAPFRELVDEEVTTLDSRYDCEGRCPTDIPSTTLTITTPDAEGTVLVEAGAETPALLDRLMNALDTASQHVSAGECNPEPPTETS